MSDEDKATLQARIAELEAQNQKLKEDAELAEMRRRVDELEASNVAKAAEIDKQRKDLVAREAAARDTRLNLARDGQSLSRARADAIADESIRVFASSALDRKTPADNPVARKLLAAHGHEPSDTFAVQLRGVMLGSSYKVDGNPVNVRHRRRRARRPPTLELSPERHELVVEAPGFKPKVIHLDGRAGDRQVVDVRLSEKADE